MRHSTKVRTAKEKKGTVQPKGDRAEDEVKPLKGKTPWMPPGWNKLGRRESEAREDARKPGRVRDLSQDSETTKVRRPDETWTCRGTDRKGRALVGNS